MVEVPDDTPYTIPELVPTVATLVVLLLHMPPPVVLLSVVLLPTHTVDEPVIAAGSGLTVTTSVAKHPVDTVYVIVDVPKPTLVTIPDEVPTVATVRSLLLQVPPPVVLLNVIEEPRHSDDGPEITGNGITVTTNVT
jgi:hypothetical protein